MTKHLAPLALTLAVAACAQSPAPSSSPAPSVGLPNPASVYCHKLGGKLTIQKSAGGQVGICSLPDGTQMEEWALYRRDQSGK